MEDKQKQLNDINAAEAKRLKAIEEYFAEELRRVELQRKRALEGCKASHDLLRKLVK